MMGKEEIKESLRKLIEDLREHDEWVDSTIDYDAGHRNATQTAIEGITEILKEI